MNILNLASFIEIVNENSISKAARKLHISQSALSQQLKSIENDLDANLLKRSNKGVHTTEEGNTVFKYAEIFVQLLEEMEKELEGIKTGTFMDIRLISSNSICEQLLPCTMYSYKKQEENVRFISRCSYTKGVIESLKSNSADVGLITSSVDMEGIKCEKLDQEELVLIFSPRNKMIKEEVSIDDLLELPFLIGPEESGIRKEIERNLMEHDLSLEKLDIHMELSGMEGIKTSVMENYGVAIVPYMSVKKEIYTKSLDYRRIKDVDFTCDICLVYREDVKYEEHIIKFIDFMRKSGKTSFC